MSSIPQVFAGLNRTPLLNDDQTVSWQWIKGFNALAQAVGSPALSGSVPASSTAQGTPGQIANDGTFIYVCIATNTWARAALSTF